MWGRSNSLYARLYSGAGSKVGQRSFGDRGGVGRLVDNLILGETSQSHSTLLQNGKCVYEFIIHNVKPQANHEYRKLVGEKMRKLFGQFDKDVKLYGSWTTTLGPTNESIHILKYNNYQAMSRFHQTRRSSKDWKQFRQELDSMIAWEKSEASLEFAFLKSIDPHSLLSENSIFELRTYQLKPGSLLQWSMSWRDGMEARRKWTVPVGCWFTQLGPLHQVRHLWAYKNLADRQASRAKAWDNNEWGQTVAKTVPLVEKMDSRIMELIE